MRSRRWRTLGVTLAAVSLLVGCADDTAQPDSEPTGSASTEEVVPLADAETRRAVLDAAEEFWIAFFTYGPDLLADDGKLTGYVDNVTPHVTGGFRQAFEDNLSLAESAVTEFEATSTTQVTGVGASGIADDRATVIVGSTITKGHLDGDETVTGTPDPARAELHLLLVDDTWLVDDVGMDGSSLNPDAEAFQIERPTDHWSSDVLAVAEETAAVVLSYAHDDLDAGTARAQPLMTDNYRAEYDAVREAIKPAAIEQRATVAATVADAGLGRHVTPERADVLLFIDQQVTKPDEEQSLLRQTAVLTMVLVDGRWLLDDIRTN